MSPGLILLAIVPALLAGYSIAVTLIRWAEAAIRLFFGDMSDQDCDR